MLLLRRQSAVFFSLASHALRACEARARIRLLRHALPISLLILRKKPTVLQSTNQRLWPDSGQILRHQYGIFISES